MNKKAKVLLTSAATIAMCASLAVGGTYALFTSESEVNVAVTSGTVNMVAYVKDGSVKTYSGEWDSNSDSYLSVEQASGAFANGGTATVSQESNTIEINRITPMDKVEFEIEVVNNSNVTVQYQTKVELIEGVDLFSALEISIDGKTYDGMTAYSDWATLVYDGNDESEVVDTIKVSIALPDDENNNDVQGKSVKLAYTVNAVQGNAHTQQPEADENTLYIYNANDMKLFANSVNKGNTFAGKTVKLMSSVDLENEEWTPIGNSSNKFCGTFDGNGKTVSNLKISGNKSYVGLFGYTTNGAVKNLTVKNADVSGYLGVGVVAGSPYTSTYDNISVVGDVKVNGFAYVGGVLGRNAYANVSNVIVNVNDGSYVKANSVEDGVAYRTYVGGVIGFMGEGSHTVSNVVSNIEVIGSTCDVGGIVGIAHYGNSFIKCVSSGDVTITSATEEADALEIGGIAGVWNNGGAEVTFTDCSYTGTLTSLYEGEKITEFSYGGLVGKAYNSKKDSILVLNGETIYYVCTQEKFNELIAKSNVALNIELGEGRLTLDSASGSNATFAISGRKTSVVDVVYGSYHERNVLSFNGVTIDGAVGYVSSNNGATFGSDYAALYSPNVIYTNCYFDGGFRVGRDGAKFIKCTFDLSDTNYVWTYGNDVTFENCTFNTNGKSLLIYADGGNEISKVSVTGCTFNATASAFASAIATNPCAAIEIDNYGCGVDLTTGSNTVDSKFSGEWRIKSYYDNGNTVTVNGTEYTTICVDGKTITKGENGSVKIDGVWYVNNLASLQSALDNATGETTIALIADVLGDVTVAQKADVKVRIEGNGYTYAGVIVVDGGSAQDITAGLTINQVNFKADRITGGKKDAYIQLGGTNDSRYVANLTVSNCTFGYTGSGDIVAVKSYTGGDKNLTLTGCTVSEGMHSLLQVNNVAGKLTIDGCTVNSKNGVNLNSCTNVEIKNSTFNTKGYCVRFGVNSGGNPDEEKTFVFTKNTLTSQNDDSDAVIIFRTSAANTNTTVTMTETTLTGTNNILYSGADDVNGINN